MNISRKGEDKLMIDGTIYKINLKVREGEKDGLPITVYRQLDPIPEIILEFNTATSEGRGLMNTDDDEVIKHATARAIIDAFEDNKKLSIEEYDKLYWDMVEK